jgi:hypothetical protein
MSPLSRMKTGWFLGGTQTWAAVLQQPIVKGDRDDAPSIRSPLSVSLIVVVVYVVVSATTTHGGQQVERGGNRGR